MNMKDERPYDIILLGATGFTGKLTAEYLASNAPEGLKWAIAGRNETKLDAVKKHLAESFSVEIDSFTADTSDQGSLDVCTSSTRVLISTVGPYDKHGWLVVKSCVENLCHYADITGEPLFVNRVRKEFHEEAKQQELKIIHCCGFDSIPHDLGVLFTVNELGGQDSKSIDGFVVANGEFSGGTWHSALGAMRKTPWSQMRTSKPRPERSRKIRSTAKKIFFHKELKRWAVPLPTIDPQIVCRSAAMLPKYGTEFSYGHYIRMRSLTKMIGLVGGIASLAVAAKVPFLQALAFKVKSPGDGPSEEKRAKSWFKVRFIGTTKDRRVVTEVSGGDPGYSETSKMLAESALCLACDQKQLPEQYGVITTAVAMGEVLIDRLENAGIKFEVIEKGAK